MDLLNPSFGLFFWMLLGFGILVFILTKYAFPVILSSIKNREQYVAEQLQAADKIRQNMDNIQAERQQLMEKAKEERDSLIADAKKIRDKLYEETKQKANNEANAIIEEAKQAIHFEKMKAVIEIKNEIANMSIEIAEKILKQELSDTTKQEDIVKKWVNEINLN